MTEIEINIEHLELSRQSIENEIHNLFQFRYPTHDEYLALSPKINKLKELKASIDMLQLTLTAHKSNLTQNKHT